jgi:transposase
MASIAVRSSTRGRGPPRGCRLRSGSTGTRRSPNSSGIRPARRVCSWSSCIGAAPRGGNFSPQDTLKLAYWDRLLINHLVPEAKPGGRPEEYSKREILNGIFYLVRSGCAWRMLPHDLPPWPIIYHYFRQWRNDGTWQLIHDLLRGDVRVAAGKQRRPSAGIIDSQSVKTTEKGGSTATMATSTSTAANGIFWSIA